MRPNAPIILLGILFTFGLSAMQSAAPQWWDLNAIGTSRPAARSDAAMAPSGSGGVVLFGGHNDSTDLNDTWMWTAQGWQEQEPSSLPPPMKWARMVYDSWRDRNVLVGYSSDPYRPGPQTWLWDGGDWVELPGFTLRAEPGFSLAFDETSGEVVLFGGAVYGGAADPCLDDTWVLTGGTLWTWVGGSHPPNQTLASEAATETTFASPPPRGHGAMVYDRQNSQVVLHGGIDACGGETLTDTWVWDGAPIGWIQRFPALAPPPNNEGYQMAYYGLGGHVVVAGCAQGFADACTMYDPTRLWKWDGELWSEIPGPGPMDPTEPWTAPKTDYGFAFSEVPAYGGLLLFGGHEVPSVLDETWAWGELPDILNTAPTARILSPGEVACTAPTGAAVTLDGSDSFDSQNQPLTFRWSGPFGSLFGQVVDAPLPIGESSVTLTVNDGSLDGTATQLVTVTIDVHGLENPLGSLVSVDVPPSPPAVSFEAGRTLPLKLQLSCGQQALTSADVDPPKLVAVNELPGLESDLSVSIPPVIAADTDGVFRSQNTNWIYNLSTKDLGPGAYELLIEMPDGLFYRSIVALR